MTFQNDDDSGFSQHDDYFRDPNGRVAQYPHARMYIYFNGRPAEDDPYEYEIGNGRSVAESVARLIEIYILASAETNFRGELTFKVHLPPPLKNPGFVAWENGPSW
jgi:hypothetical protein